MRARMLRDLPPEGPWDVKAMPGGLVEVEFIAQALQLRHGADTPGVLSPTTREALARLGAAGLLPEEEAAALVAADRLWREVIGVVRLTVGRTRDAALPAPAAAALLRIAAPLLDPPPVDLDGLREQMGDTARTVRAIFERRVGGLPSGAGRKAGDERERTPGGRPGAGLRHAGERRAAGEPRALKGSPFLLYFYPKADTPGCTKQACGIQEALPQLGRLGLTVVGISPDALPPIEKFAAKFGLAFPLASDADIKSRSATACGWRSPCTASGTWAWSGAASWWTRRARSPACGAR
jgi:hypothetical protein